MAVGVGQGRLTLDTLIAAFVMTPMMAMILNIPGSQLAKLLIALMVGSMGLTLSHRRCLEGARRGTALITLLILPLAVPLLIFGTLASQSEMGIINPHLMLLGAVFIILLAVAPLVAACALEIGETETGL